MLTKVLPCYYNLTGIVMRASTSSRHVFHTRIPFRCSPSLIRWSSTATLQSSLRDNLTSRAPHTVFDYLSPTPSHLLNVTLADFLPESCYPPGFSKDDLRLPFIGNPSTDPFPLPQGHHLVYFSPQVPSSSLLTDGTDPLQCPGEPFVRRMWAGGSLQFENNSINRLATDNQRSCCTEYISDVSVKGLEGDEKVFVTIARKIGNLSQTTYPSTTHYKSPNELELDYLAGATRGEDVGQWALIEKRNLVFMRQKSAAAAKEDVAKPGKILKRMFIFDILLYYITSIGKKLIDNRSISWAWLQCRAYSNTIPLVPLFSSYVQCTCHPSWSPILPWGRRAPEPTCTWAINADPDAFGAQVSA